MSTPAQLAALADCRKAPPGVQPVWAKIAREHGVSPDTLRKQYNATLLGKVIDPDARKLLTNKQEEVLLKYLEGLGKRNLFLTPTILRNIVAEITNHYPSDSWARRFVKKHDGRIRSMMVGGMEASRHAAEYKPVFERYFDCLEKTCQEYGFGAEAIYNMDEKGFFMGKPNKQRMIVPRAQMERPGGPLSRIDGNRTWISLIACIGADGTALVPSLIFPGVNVGEGWMDELSEEDQYRITVSEKGWTSQEIGLRWLLDVFDPETRNKPGNRQRLLILDGHSSHVNQEFIERCISLRIYLLVLPPHSTHCLQPLDVGFFSPLSTAYTTAMNQQWQASEGRLYINKARFFGCFMKALKKVAVPSTILRSFEKAGVSPPGRQIVLDKFFPPPPPIPHTPSPAPTLVNNPTSSPLHEGSSQQLLNQVRSNKKEAPRAVLKMNSRIKEVEAENKLLAATNAALREVVKQAANKRAFKPLVLDHEQGEVCLIGPEQVAAQKRKRAEEAADLVRVNEEKAARLEAKRIQRAQEQAEKDARRAVREANAARKEEEELEKLRAKIMMSERIKEFRRLNGRPLAQLDPNHPGPSNHSRQ